ncbi:cytochrome c oxidase accessory protein CcoG [Nibrella viscosa]|uniref:Cytochrome c oxidase accessory protein CcoG n=1 Tax=Nibrella viscosa TaxID=1084524 RepID=A0ABP8KHP6_9BACT
MHPAQDTFRNHLSNAGEHGGRKWLHPRVIKGSLYRWRTVVAWVLLAALFAGPFLSYNGHPLFMFNVLERQFIFFGVTFWPQDFHLMAIGLITFIVFITLFTVVYGRVWCGWACPQTIFMEMVFRKIEIWIEGDHNRTGGPARKRLEAAPWTADKVMKKTAKHAIFFLISFAISNTFLAYIIGKDALLEIVTDNPANHLGGLASILIFTGAFYVVFAKLREIVCITICPYGRLQGVLLDKNSIVVAYDDVRGEPRGKIRKNEAPIQLKGDCIDCALCVHVCPTGIDIRNGTQLECIHCTACIDACDSVMDKVGRPRGLIRYDSPAGIQEKKPLRFTGRIMAYSGVLVALIAVLVFLLVSRTDIETTLLRAPGQLYQHEANGMIANLYTIELVNKTYRSVPVQFRLSRPDAVLRMVQPLTEVPANDIAKGVFFILLPEKSIHESSTKLELEVISGNKIIKRSTTSFLGPVN